MSATAQLMLFETPAPTTTPVLTPVITPLVTPGAPCIELLHPPAPTAVPTRRRAQAWLALHFAELALAAAYHSAPPDQRRILDSSPWAVIDEDRLKHVVACNALAWKHAVRPGHRMNAAIALCSSIVLLTRDPAAETRLLEKIATDCLRYTSAVSMQPPNEVLLEVRGSLRLFGGPTALIERVQADLADMQAGLQVALAPTARSAQWIARASTTPSICLPRELAATLSALPIACLQWELPIELQLTRFGVTNLGDLMRLSRTDLARRIGKQAVHELNEAMGRATALHRGWSTPPHYYDRVLLDFEIETTGLLEKMLERALSRLKRTLIGSARAIDELNITLKHREGATTMALRLQQATADMAHVARLLHEHLERLVLRAPVREVLIEAPRLLIAKAHTRALAMDPATQREVPEAAELASRLLEQLQSRFGIHAIRALAPRAHHVPERAQASALPMRLESRVTPPAQLPRRPLWLLPEPTPVTYEYRKGAYRIESSPETIEAEDWDGESVRRAYYRARTPQGIECWIYRDLKARDQWFVHGHFG